MKIKPGTAANGGCGIEVSSPLYRHLRVAKTPFGLTLFDDSAVRRPFVVGGIYGVEGGGGDEF